MPDVGLTTYLFSDIAGSTRLWEADPDGAARALSWHDELSRATVNHHQGTVVKMTGDGLHAAFGDSLAATAAAIDLQVALGSPPADVPALSVRCGLHIGADQQRDGDFFGPAVNRAARIMSAANGGQILLSGALAQRIAPRLPPDVILRDLGLVRLKDLAAPERVFQVVHPLLRTEFPPPRSLASVPNNLPVQLDTFVGREREMGEVRALVAKARLVTLLAFGGVGKSRLAVQLGAEVLDEFPDGVWLVELAGLQSGGAVAQPVAATLGVKERPVGDILDALVDALRDREMLLILDNCEHVVDSAAALAKRLLQTTPRLKILATSRDALKITGEQIYALGPLAVPNALDSTVPALERHAAVQLFLDRVVAAQPAFRINERTAAAVAAICRGLDGIPLALELAAARARAMTVATIAARLDERFALLRSGDGTVLPRQRTLRALIDWSHGLLSEPERAAFRRLAVFAGGWTLEAAEAVLGADGMEPDSVVELVGSVVEKSLASLQPDSGHYRMMETVRQYALDRLHESGEEVSTRERHLAYFVAFAERSRPHLQGSDQSEWLARLDALRENLVAAFAWCDRSPAGVEAAVSLVANLKYYWLSRGMFGTGYEIAARTVARAAAVGGDAYVQALVDAGTIATFVGRYREAKSHYTEGLALACAADDRQREFIILQYLGEVEFALGDRSRAIERCQRAEDIARSTGDARWLATALNAKAQLLRALGRIDDSQPLYVEALALARQQGDEEQIATALLNLASVAVLKEQIPRARELLIEAFSVAESIGSQAAGQAYLDVCAGLAALASDWQTAARLLAAAEEQARRSRLGRDPADQAFVDEIGQRVRSAAGAYPTDVLSYDEAMALSHAWLSAELLKKASADPAPPLCR